MIVEDNGAHHLRQTAIFRKFIKGDQLKGLEIQEIQEIQDLFSPK